VGEQTVSKYRSAIVNLAKNEGLTDDKRHQLYLLAVGKRNRAQLVKVGRIGLFALVAATAFVALLLSGFGQLAFKSVGAALAVIALLMNIINAEIEITSEEYHKIAGKYLSQVDRSALNNHLSASINTDSWIKLLSAVVAYAAVLILLGGK